MENEINIIRPTWDQYFIKLAWLVAERSTCERHHVGAVIVRDKRILTTGYNGAASGIKDCLKLGCLRNKLNIPSGTKFEDLPSSFKCPKCRMAKAMFEKLE